MLHLPKNDEPLRVLHIATHGLIRCNINFKYLSSNNIPLATTTGAGASSGRGGGGVGVVKSYSTNLTEDELLLSNHLPQPDCNLIKSMCVCMCV
jgi:hypothetical protein